MLDAWSCVTPLDKALWRSRKVNLKQIEQAALALKHGQETELSTVLEQAEDWAMRLHSLSEEVRIHRWELSTSPKKSKTIPSVLDLLLLSVSSFSFSLFFGLLFVSVSFVTLPFFVWRKSDSRERRVHSVSFSAAGV